MNLRAVPVSLFVASLLYFPAVAGQPAGLAANLITDLGDPGFLPPLPPSQCESLSFEWVEAVGPSDLEPGDTLRLEMAIAPFRTGTTFVGLDKVDGQTFFGIEFSDGLVKDLPYKRTDWNNLVVELRPTTQDYLITINGVQGGPFAYAEFCRDLGGCFSVQALRINGYSNEPGSAAWLDTIVVSRESAGGSGVLLEITFDTCSSRPYVVGGVILIADPPRPLFHRGRCDGR